MIRQPIIDACERAVQALSLQGKRSALPDGMCLYRNGNDKCAVGHIIDDDLNYGLFGGVAAEEVEQALNNTFRFQLTMDEIIFLSHFQTECHDGLVDLEEDFSTSVLKAWDNFKRSNASLIDRGTDE